MKSLVKLALSSGNIKTIKIKNKTYLGVKYEDIERNRTQH